MVHEIYTLLELIVVVHSFFFVSVFRIPPEPLLKLFLWPVQLFPCLSVRNKSSLGERIVMNLENFKKKCLAVFIVL
jgi:hypothetical protein